MRREMTAAAGAAAAAVYSGAVHITFLQYDQRRARWRLIDVIMHMLRDYVVEVVRICRKAVDH